MGEIIDGCPLGGHVFRLDAIPIEMNAKTSGKAPQKIVWITSTPSAPSALQDRYPNKATEIMAYSVL